MPGRLDGYDVVESRLLPQFADIEADTTFAIFMNAIEALGLAPILT